MFIGGTQVAKLVHPTFVVFLMIISLQKS